MLFKNYFLCVQMCSWCLWRSEAGFGFPGTGVTHGCELLSGFWESNPIPHEKQPVLLTASPSLQPLLHMFFFFLFEKFYLKDMLKYKIASEFMKKDVHNNTL